MRLGVCIKEVPDTVAKIVLSGDQKSVVSEGMQTIINPYDEFALEAALRVKDQDANTEVVVISVGGERSAETLRKALAMGGDRGVHVLHEGGMMGDALTISQILRQVTLQEKLEALFLGKQAIDDDQSQVGSMLAELLQWSQGMNIVTASLSGGQPPYPVTAIREVEGGSREQLGLSLPCLLGFTKGEHEPRYPSLKGIMAAKKKEIKRVAVQDLDVAVANRFAPKIIGFRLPAERQACHMVQGDAPTAAESLVKMLREQAKVI